MSTQSNPGVQHTHQNRMNDLNISFSSMYQFHAPDPTSGHNSPYVESHYDNYQLSTGQLSRSYFDNLSNTGTWMSEQYPSLTES